MDPQEKAWLKEYAESKGYSKDELLLAKLDLQDTLGFATFKAMKQFEAASLDLGYSKEAIQGYIEERKAEWRSEENDQREKE